METKEQNKLEKIVSLCKRRGFIFPGSEIYGGLAGTWDLGPYGALMMHNIKDMWWRRFVSSREDMYAVSTTAIMPEKVWEASGHLKHFNDPLLECKKCKKRFRADHLDNKEKCPACGGEFGEEKKLNQMFPLEVGTSDGGTVTAYLRGELAQGMFTNFKNILDTMHVKLPFGIAQIGRVYRNEISPRDFLGRVREFELAEFEYFVKEEEAEKSFEYWLGEMRGWMDELGIDRSKVKEHELNEKDRAHYSARTVDFEYDSPFGDLEFQAIANRTTYDLNNHTEATGVDLSFRDEEKAEKIVPYEIEPTFGLTRTLLTLLLDAYREDELGGEKRVFLRLSPQLAPVKVAVFPLLKNKPDLVAKAREVYQLLRSPASGIQSLVWDDNGNIGKRYRRQDEIGTPFCVTVDFDTLADETVTVRHRDSGVQDRLHINDLATFLKEKIK